MPRKSSERAAQGAGSIKKTTRTVKGVSYTYWATRYTVGRDSGTGKQVQKTKYFKTQQEARRFLTETTLNIDQDDYFEPTKTTVGAWLDIWAEEYLNGVKPRTVDSYKSVIAMHIKPALGATRLSELTPTDVQRFYNRLRKSGRLVPRKDSDGKVVLDANKKIIYDGTPMSPKTISNVHGVLHGALEKARRLGYIRSNPADKPDLPKIQKAEINPMDDAQIKAFLAAISGQKYESIYTITLFTGMREGEVLGLPWECVDFANGTITIKQQLQLRRGAGGLYDIVTPKNGKTRTLTAAPFVMEWLKKERARQRENKLRAGSAWNNSQNLVFTAEDGKHLIPHTVYHHFKKLAEKAGVHAARFHDLRHSYAVAALRSGDDIKTVQENLGHHTAAFTLDTYAHCTEQMKRESAARMEQFIKTVKA